MSTREINLISEKPGYSRQEKYLKNMADRYLPVILITFILITIATYSINMFLDKTIADYDKNMSAEQNKISKMDKNEGMYLMLKQKATAINTILSSHYPFDEIFEFAKSLEQQGGTLNNFILSETGELTFTMKVDNTAKLEDMVNVTIAKAKETFKRVELNSINYKTDASFEITFLIEMQNI